MITRLIELSVARRGLVAITALVLLVAGALYLRTTPVDAIPDLSDVQVIVYTDYPGQAPQVVEDQVTYPLVTAMLGVPNTKVVRGQSMFSTSFVYVIFQEGTDLYWARSRVLERLNAIQAKLPPGAKTELALMPPASAGCTSMRWKGPATRSRSSGRSRTSRCAMPFKVCRASPRWRAS